MTRPLDGTALFTYFRRLELLKEARRLLAEIRDSLPSRTPGAHQANMPVWYPFSALGISLHVPWDVRSQNQEPAIAP